MIIAAIIAGILTGMFQPEVRSAYLTRGRVVEDRAIQLNTLRLAANLGEEASFGQLGFWHLDYSALTRRNAATRERFLFESCYGLTYHYDLRLTDDFTLSQEVMPCWITLRDYHSKTELWYITSLRNKYLTPYCWLRAGIHNGDFFYARLGLKKTIALGGGFSLTPSIASELGNARHMMNNYAVSRSRAHSGIRDILSRLELTYRLSANWALFAYVEQYDVLDRRIRNAAGQKTPRDLTIGSLGVRLSF